MEGSTYVSTNDNSEFRLEAKIGSLPVLITGETTFVGNKDANDIFAMRNMLYYVLDHAAADMVKKPSKDYLIEVISRGLLQVIRDNEAVVKWINDIHERPMPNAPEEHAKEKPADKPPVPGGRDFNI